MKNRKQKIKDYFKALGNLINSESVTINHKPDIINQKVDAFISEKIYLKSHEERWAYGSLFLDLFLGFSLMASCLVFIKYSFGMAFWGIIILCSLLTILVLSRQVKHERWREDIAEEIVRLNKKDGR